MGEFFKFEDENMDFPFYNGIPQLSKIDWIVFALAPFLIALISLSGGRCIPFVEMLPNGTLPVCYFLVSFIPIAYICHGKLGLIFKKPKLKDFKVIIICFILYFIFSIVFGYLANYLGFATNANPAMKHSISLLPVILTLIQLMGEELFKVSVLLISMGVIYKFTKNRKNTMIFGTFICMMLFGLIHLTAYNYNIFQCLILIGLGSIIHLYPYIKTKNIVNSYLVHILIDLTFMTMATLV